MTTDRAPKSKRPRRTPRPSGDAGFSLLEVLVALSVISVVMGATAPFLVRSVAVVGQQRSQQVGIEVANDALERARALSPSSLLAGRGRTAVQNQLAAAPDAVKSLMSPAQLDADPALTSVTDLLLGANAPLPTVANPVTVGGVEYLQSWYVGRCWQTKADSTVPSTDLGNCAETQPTGPGVISVPFFRVVVAVTWRHNGCSDNQCVYVTSTLVSPSADPVFDLKRPPPTITDPANQENYVGDTVDLELFASGGTLPRTWTVTGLPPGLTVSSIGVITGMPTTPGTYPVAVKVQDRTGNSDDATFTWTVAALPSLTSPGPQLFWTGAAVSLPIVLSGGLQPATWTAVGLPAGLTINASTGIISGTPTTEQTTPQTATVTVVDKGLKTATTTFTWQVLVPLTLGSPGLQTTSTGVPVSYAFAGYAHGGLVPYTWTATNLPPGLSMNASTGTVSGSIQWGSRYLVTVQVTDSTGSTASIVVPIRVNVGPSEIEITDPNPDNPDQTSTVNSWVSLRADSHASGKTWSATGLPPGLSIDDKTGVISGRPTTAGTYRTTIILNTASSKVANLMLTWTVTP